MPKRDVSTPASIHSAARSAIISVGELVLPLVIVGMTLASTTRRPGTPRTRRRASSTAIGSPAGPCGGADRVEDRRADVAGQPREFVVGLELRRRA